MMCVHATPVPNFVKLIFMCTECFITKTKEYITKYLSTLMFSSSYNV